MQLGSYSSLAILLDFYRIEACSLVSDWCD